jgi:hypothetical protein
MLMKGNGRTKSGYLYMCIPLGHVNRAVDRLFTFKDLLVIVVEIVNDEEFVDSYRGAKNVGYLLTYEDKGTPKIIITESRKDDFIDICIRGFIDVLRFMGRDALQTDEELYLRIKEMIDEEKNSVPLLEKVEKEEVPQELVVDRPKGSGVPVSYFTLLVKVSSINQKYRGGFDKFIDDTTSKESSDSDKWPWQCDGRLLSRSATASDDLEDTIRFLIQNGLQCKTSPPDFYSVVIDSGLMDDQGVSHYYLTVDDGQIEYFKEEGNIIARLKSEEG